MRSAQALGLPAGSVRALLALGVFGTVWTWLVVHPETRMPEYLQNLMFIALGHYFASRGKPPVEGDASPLFLPRGVLRVLFVGGFVAIAVVLARSGHARFDDPENLSPGVLTLVLVAGFLVGVVSTRLVAVWRKDRPLPRVVEDARAIVSLAATVVLVLMVFDVWVPPIPLQRYLVEDLLAALVGFYFGSRS